MSFNAFFQAEASRLGFPLAGVAPLAEPPHWAAYEAWIAAGRHAGMAYLAAEEARARRKNPALLLPQARSLLVVALRYPAPASLPAVETGEAAGRVAAYAWGQDYHEVIPPLLEELLAQIEKYLGRPLPHRSYTDTGPILEHDFAQVAGLGWTGKNTNLISPRQGSYFLLAESLVEADLEPSPPFQADHCGTCRRCIEACPTACIRPDRTIDAGRCISYLTIENKGPIPPDLRPKMGEWVFGCDVCQMVCPWNVRFAAPQGHPALEPRPEKIGRPLLRREIRLTPHEFNQKFRRSPIRRAKRRGYLRNVAVAMGNQRDAASIPALAEVMEGEPEALIRSHAAWALGQMRSPRARQILEKSRAKEQEPAVLAEITAALAESS